MAKRKPPSRVLVVGQIAQTTSGPTEESTFFSTKQSYVPAEITWVSLDEVTRIVREDSLLEAINMIAGVVLGLVLDRLMTTPNDGTWTATLLVCLAVIAYRYYRKYQQDAKVSELKKKAISHDSIQSTRRG